VSQRILLPLLLLVSAGCDLPLDLPTWETRWILDAASDTLRAEDFLPAGVRITPEGFAVDPLESGEEVTLEEICEFCICLTGPVPSLTLTPFDWGVPLPGGIRGAHLTAGTATLALINRLGFDLLRDGNGGEGFLSVELLDLREGRTLDSLRIDSPFPPGDTLHISFPLGGLELHRGVVARVRGEIPGTGCDTIPLTPELGIGTEVRIQGVVAERVQLSLSDGALSLPSRRIPIPGALGERLRPGVARVLLEVEVESRVPAEVEATLSVAARPGELFTGEAGLYTPFLIPPFISGAPDGTVRRTFLLELSRLQGAGELHLATRTRILGDRVVELTGAESLRYRVTLHAELPSR